MPSGSSRVSNASPMAVSCLSWRARERVEHVLADGRNVSGRGGDDRVPAGGGELGVRGAPVLGAGEPSDEVAGLESLNDVREPRQGGVGAAGESRHPQGATGRLGQHGQDEVVEVAQARIAPQLGVDHPGQELDHGHEPQPRGPLIGIQPSRVHDVSIPDYLKEQLLQSVRYL